MMKSNLVVNSKTGYKGMSLRAGISLCPLDPFVAHYIESLEMRIHELQEGLSGMIKQQTDILGSKRDLTVLTMQPIVMIKHIEELLEEN